MKKLVVLLALLGGCGLVQAQTTRYVTDSLRLEARSGPGVEHRIVKMLDSGTAVRVLEEADGWSRIALPGEENAWILSRFLMEEPSARNRLAAAESARDAALAEKARLEEELARLRTERGALAQARDELERNSREQAEELSDIKRTAASTIAIQRQNRELEDRSRDLEQKLAGLERDYSVLRESRERDWFVAGAGVLLGGAILGLIIPKIRWRRRRGWGEL